MSDKLHLGCGDVYLPGWVNLDIGECKADVYHNLDELPYPFADDTFDTIIANHVIEHLARDKWPKIVDEFYRISAPNAIWDFRCPYALSDDYATDPTHTNPLSARSFDYFDPTRPLGRLGQIYGFKANLRVVSAELNRESKTGPEVRVRLLVAKEDKAPVRIPEGFVNPLYADELTTRYKLRKIFYKIPGMLKLRGKV
ncbi:MAG: class I SAM-dependent methyltransferase [Armatimonas sp.]